MNDLANTISTILEQTNLTESDLAVYWSTSLAAIVDWRNGVSAPSPQQVERIEATWNLVKAGKFNRKEVTASDNAFASTGVQRTLPMFTVDTNVSILTSPKTSIYAQLCIDDVFHPDGKSAVQSLLDIHSAPTTSAENPPKSGMSAGKNTYTYDAHTYHTKMPPQGVAELLSHYLPNGGLVFDPFAGSGMTGVAARVLGYDCILNELSPAACFIAHHFTQTIEPTLFQAGFERVMEALQNLRHELYMTHSRETGKLVEVEYFVWSFNVKCPNCGHILSVWEHARHYGKSVREHKIKSKFPCPNCDEVLKKSKLERLDTKPVLVAYRVGRKIVRHPVDEYDVAVQKEFENRVYLATEYIPETQLYKGINLRQPMKHGIRSVDEFYTLRNLIALSHIWRQLHFIEDANLAGFIAYVFTSLYQRVTKFSEFRFWGGSGNMARFNLPYVFKEANVFTTMERKAQTIHDHLVTTASHYKGRNIVMCGSATDLSLMPSSSVDLIFTDPPFGGNINYSEMNILWESWLGVYTDNEHEAIINKFQEKGLPQYADLMRVSFAECHRVLRDGQWMLVVFMNSSQEVWDALRTSITSCGFVIVQVDIFDKQHSTFKQLVSENTVGANLILHCRKVEDALVMQSIDYHADIEQNIVDFLSRKSLSQYTTKFIHVERDDEFDYSRLYGEWIAQALEIGITAVDFVEFRAIVDKYLNKKQD